MAGRQVAAGSSASSIQCSDTSEGTELLLRIGSRVSCLTSPLLTSFTHCPTLTMHFACVQAVPLMTMSSIFEDLGTLAERDFVLDEYLCREY